MNLNQNSIDEIAVQMLHIKIIKIENAYNFINLYKLITKLIASTLCL